MAHNIHGFVAGSVHLREVLEDESPGRVISLPQGFAFMPSGDESLARVRAVLARSPDATAAGYDSPLDWDWSACPLLFPEEVRFARWLSVEEPVAWVETDYFGGSGFQSAASWVLGEIVVGPLKTGAETALLDGAINRALRSIGVAREARDDEFDTLGLGRYRDNEEWIERA